MRVIRCTASSVTLLLHRRVCVLTRLSPARSLRCPRLIGQAALVPSRKQPLVYSHTHSPTSSTCAHPSTYSSTCSPDHLPKITTHIFSYRVHSLAWSSLALLWPDGTGAETIAEGDEGDSDDDDVPDLVENFDDAAAKE